jgi:hypothetical protein
MTATAAQTAATGRNQAGRRRRGPTSPTVGRWHHRPVTCTCRFGQGWPPRTAGFMDLARPPAQHHLTGPRRPAACPRPCRSPSRRPRALPPRTPRHTETPTTAQPGPRQRHPASYLHVSFGMQIRRRCDPRPSPTPITNRDGLLPSVWWGVFDARWLNSVLRPRCGRRPDSRVGCLTFIRWSRRIQGGSRVQAPRRSSQLRNLRAGRRGGVAWGLLTPRPSGITIRLARHVENSLQAGLAQGNGSGRTHQCMPGDLMTARATAQLDIMYIIGT